MKHRVIWHQMNPQIPGRVAKSIEDKLEWDSKDMAQLYAVFYQLVKEQEGIEYRWKVEPIEVAVEVEE